MDDYYLRVLNWRVQERQTSQIKCLTVGIAILTVVITIATLVNVGFPRNKGLSGWFCGVRAVRRGIWFVPVGACVVADEVVVVCHTPSG